MINNDKVLVVILEYCRIKDMYYHISERSGLKAPLVSDEVYEIIMKVLLELGIFLYVLDHG